jgi:hypothetical protein
MDRGARAARRQTCDPRGCGDDAAAAAPAVERRLDSAGPFCKGMPTYHEGAMRRLLMKGVLLVFAALAGMAAPALAQNREKAWEINPYVGYLAFDKVQGEKLLDNTWDIGLRFGYHWTKRHMVEFGFSGGSTKNPSQDLSVDLLGGQINYNYNFFLQRRDRIVAFASGGMGLMNISTFGFVSNNDLIGDHVDISWNVGGGIRFFGGRRAGFRMDLHRTHFSDSGTDINFYEATVGMSIVLGGTY